MKTLNNQSIYFQWWECRLIDSVLLRPSEKRKQTKKIIVLIFRCQIGKTLCFPIYSIRSWTWKIFSTSSQRFPDADQNKSVILMTRSMIKFGGNIIKNIVWTNLNDTNTRTCWEFSFISDNLDFVNWIEPWNENQSDNILFEK